jgi:hypothetical protein
MAGYIYQEETEEQLKQLGISGQALNRALPPICTSKQSKASLTRSIQARRKRAKQQWRKKIKTKPTGSPHSSMLATNKIHHLSTPHR